jgi:hypothetical protein
MRDFHLQAALLTLYRVATKISHNYVRALLRFGESCPRLFSQRARKYKIIT